MSRPIRVLLAKPGLDGHDVGVKVVAQALRDAGMEVIYTGLRQPPAAIAKTALEEGVDVVGLSVLSGAHLVLCSEVALALRDHVPDGVLLLVGGVIPARDRVALADAGYRGIFPGGTKLSEIVSFINENVKVVLESGIEVQPTYGPHDVARSPNKTQGKK